MNILLAGFGYITKCLAEHLKKDNYKVIAIKRKKVEFSNDHIQLICRDLITNDNPLSMEDKPFKVVFALSPQDRDIQSYKDTYLTAQANLINALKPHLKNCLAWIVTTSTAVYQDTDGLLIKEDEANPTNEEGAILLQAEKPILPAHIPCYSLRFGGIYGPSRVQMFKSYYFNQSSNRFANMVHQHDCACAIKFFLKNNPPSGAYNVVDDSKATINDIKTFIQRSYPHLAKNWQAEQALFKKASNRNLPNRICCNNKLKSLDFSFSFSNYQLGLTNILEFQNQSPKAHASSSEK